MEYNITLRDLSSFESMNKEFEKLDLFNHPAQFNEINDQFADEYKLYIEVLQDKNIGYTFNVYDRDTMKVAFKSEYIYGSKDDAKIQGLFEMMNYIKEMNREYTPVSEEKIKKYTHNYEKHYFRLPSYVKLLQFPKM